MNLLIGTQFQAVAKPYPWIARRGANVSDHAICLLVPKIGVSVAATPSHENLVAVYHQHASLYIRLSQGHRIGDSSRLWLHNILDSPTTPRVSQIPSDRFSRRTYHYDNTADG